MKYLFPLVIFLCSCASIQVLDGGTKDETPPKIIKTSIDSASVNVSTSSFTFTFDEYIKTQKVNELLIISPSQKINPKLSIKGKKLTINLKDSLLTNTTYTIQFNGCVQDINESNPIQDYSFVFSTGEELDTLIHTGYVKDITTNNFCTDCNVQLYKNLNDSSVLKSKPDYLAKTDDNGFYKFNNLPPYTFNRIVLQDKNNNLTLDKEEFISLSKQINTTEISNDTSYIFPSTNREKLKAKYNRKNNPGKLEITFNKPINVDSTILRISDKKYDYKVNPNSDTLYTFFTPVADTTYITLISKKDTFDFLYKVSLETLDYKAKINAFKKSDTTILLNSSIEIKEIDPTELILYKDSIQVSFTYSKIAQNQYLLKHSQKDTITKLYYSNKAFTDIFNKQLETDSFRFRYSPNTSNLTVKYEIDSAQSYIIQITSNKKVIQTNYINKTQVINYKTLKPAVYKIHIIKDANRNKRWDTGDILLKKSPEPIQFSKGFELRQNWDKELIIKVL